MKVNMRFSWLAWAAVGAAGIGVCPAGFAQPGQDEAAIAKSFWRGMGAEPSVSACRTAVELLRERRPGAPKLPGMECRLGEALLEAHEATGYVPEGGGPDVSLAMDSLAQFLPAGPYANAPQAAKCRHLYARGLVIQRHYDQAKNMLSDLAADENLTVADRAFRTLYYLHGPLGLDETGLGAVEDNLAARLSEDAKPGKRPAARLLGQLQASRDASDPAEQAYARAALHQTSAYYLRSMKHADEARTEQTAVREQALRYLELNPELPAPGGGETEAKKPVQIRFWLGETVYKQGKYEEARRLMQTVAQYASDPALEDLKEVILAPTYVASCDRALGDKTPDQINAEILAVLAGGKCNEALLAWGFEALARDAAARGDAALERLYLRDLVTRAPSWVYTRQAEKRWRELEEAQPALKNAPKDQHSPADAAMQSAQLTLRGKGQRLLDQGRETSLRRQIENKPGQQLGVIAADGGVSPAVKGRVTYKVHKSKASERD